MIRTRPSRTLATLAVTASLALAALAGPAFVSAAPAPLQTGYGAVVGNTVPTTGAVQPTAAYNFSAAFDIWAKNTGPSNISKLFLTGITTGTFKEVFVTNTNTTGSCAAGPGTNDVELKCSWPNGVPVGGTIQIRVVFTTPSSGSSMPVSFEWSTSGYVTGGKNNSHGDAFLQPDSVALNGDLTKFNGGYLATGDSLIVATSSALNRNNPQSTKITAPESGIPVSAGEDSDISDCTDNYTGCFGQASILNVNNGKLYSGGFKVEIVYSVNKPGAKMVHEFDNGSFEELSACTFDENATVPNNIPCATVTTAQGKTFVTLYLEENGKTFGH